MRYYKYANRDYLEFAEKHALFGTPPAAVTMQIYSEPLQKFRLAGQGHYDGPAADRPPPIASGSRRTSIRCRSGIRRSKRSGSRRTTIRCTRSPSVR